MASPARADLPVVWLGVLASSVTHAGVGDPRDPLVCQLKAPEAACTKTISVHRSCGKVLTSCQAEALTTP